MTRIGGVELAELKEELRRLAELASLVEASCSGEQKIQK
jgi:hypothetical protein